MQERGKKMQERGEKMQERGEKIQERGEKMQERKEEVQQKTKNIPFRVQYKLFFLYLHPKGYNYFKRLPLKKFTAMDMSLSSFVKERRKQLNLTQTDLAEKSGVGLRFVRELEQGKQTLRMDKINQVLALFGHEVGAVPAASLRQ